ncbi:MAG TPA: NADH-quinone oxidoreductase subunit C [Methanoculleus sp.]|nr:NADH-quinone oxidoreductase subunit C [Methanoculleus sp.]
MKTQNTTLREIAVSDLVTEAGAFKAKRYRLVQIGCTGIGDAYEINYTFDKNYVFETVRITVHDGDVIPSIAEHYWASFVYENEIHDLYGLTVDGMSVDFSGHLIHTATKNPFRNPPEVTKMEKEKPAAEPKEGDA